MNHLNPQFKEMIAAYGAPQLDGLIEAIEGSEPEVSVRLNRRKPSPAPPHAAKVPWAELGYYLNERPKFTLDPALHQGRYYVQDASSMFIGEAIRQLTSGAPATPLLYLDACAAPGGKTTAAIDSLPDGSMVVANEYDPRRASILAENVAKWGYPDTVVTKGDTARLTKLGEIFDIVAADVPCSGEGMMRKDEVATQQWSPALVHQCAQRQREILANLWPTIRPGGHLIYSTCTFNRDENEEIIQWLIDTYGAIPVALDTPADWMIAPGIDTSLPCYRFIPGSTRGEGLFMAVCRKPGEPSHTTTAPRVKRKEPRQGAKAPKADPARDAAGWLRDSDSYRIVTDGDHIHAVAARWEPIVAACRDTLGVVDYGIRLATVKGRDLIPTQQLAMSTALATAEVATAEVDRDTALAYLRREAVSITDAPRGFVLLTHDGVPLGWVKNLGNRANNLYPQPWRILH